MSPAKMVPEWKGRPVALTMVTSIQPNHHKAVGNNNLKMNAKTATTATLAKRNDLTVTDW